MKSYYWLLRCSNLDLVVAFSMTNFAYIFLLTVPLCSSPLFPISIQLQLPVFCGREAQVCLSFPFRSSPAPLTQPAHCGSCKTDCTSFQVLWSPYLYIMYYILKQMILLFKLYWLRNHCRIRIFVGCVDNRRTFE